MSTLHIADTGLFVAMGQPSNSRYQAVRRFARRNDITFVLPERVYEEVTSVVQSKRTSTVPTCVPPFLALTYSPTCYSNSGRTSVWRPGC